MSLSRSDLDSLIQLVNSGDLDRLRTEDYEQFQYQGFDPMKIVESLAKIQKQDNISSTDLVQDIFKMIAIGIIKGSVNNRNINKMSGEGQTTVKALENRYKIKREGGKGQSSGVITFPRLMATFPDLTVKMAKKIGPKEFRGGPMNSPRLPYYLQVQVFPSIIPRALNERTKHFLKIASLCYTIDQSIQISRLIKPDLKQVAATQMNFTNIGHTSPVPSEQNRKQLFKSLPLSDDYHSILDVVSDYKTHIDQSLDIPSRQDFVIDVIGV